MSNKNNSIKALFRGIEEFNGMTPKDAVSLIGNFLLELDSEMALDERLSDAMKRLYQFISEVETISPLDMFVREEIEFRLKELHNIEEPSEELIDYIDYELLDDCEGYLDNTYIDDLIRKGIEDFKEGE